jgi:hypothetical protein
VACQQRHQFKAVEWLRLFSAKLGCHEFAPVKVCVVDLAEAASRPCP